jgi:AraC-like DNA-binding protein
MRPSFEKLIPPEGSSIRCFERKSLLRPLWHYHPEIELKFIRQGSGSRFVGDSIQSYRTGDLVLLGSNLPHHWASDRYRGKKYDREHVLIVQFLPDVFGDPFLSRPELAVVVDLLDRSKRGLQFSGATQQQAIELVERMLEAPPFERLMTLLRLLHLLASTAEARPLSSESYAPAFKHQLRTRIHMVCQYISENICDPDLSQTQIAEFAKMTPAAFCRFFKSATQRTVTEYVNELRVAYASRLLIESDASILAVSMDSGFGTASNFHRQFRQLKGMSPREYRLAYSSNTSVNDGDE